MSDPPQLRVCLYIFFVIQPLVNHSVTRKPHQYCAFTIFRFPHLANSNIMERICVDFTNKAFANYVNALRPVLLSC